jgi:hypothetical protein
MSVILDVPLPMTFTDGLAFNAFGQLPPLVVFTPVVLVETTSMAPLLDDELVGGGGANVPEPSVGVLVVLALVYAAVRK